VCVPNHMDPALRPQKRPTLEEILAEGIRVGSAILADLGGLTQDALFARKCHAIEGGHLRDLDPSSRLIALAVTDTCLEYAHDLDAIVDSFNQRCEVLPATIELLGSAQSGAFRDTRTLDELWANLRESGETLGFAVATAIALSGELPLQIHSAEVIGRAEPRSKQTLLAYAVGYACRHGCLHARHLALQVLASEKMAPEPVLAVLKGLGEGLLEPGLLWVRDASSKAIQDAETWGVASRACAGIAFHLNAPIAFELAEQGLRFTQSIRDTTALLLQLLEHADEATSASFLASLEARWSHQPFNLRGACIAIGGLPPAGHSCWESELHPRVILQLLKLLQENSDAHERLAEWAGRLLFHWDDRVRQKVLEFLTRSLRRTPAARVIPLGESAEIIRLPATTLARSPLRQLQAAVWAADSDAFVEIVGRMKRNEKRRAVKLLLRAVDVPDMAMRREILRALALVGTPKDGDAILRIGKRLRTLEGHVVDALIGVKATVSAEELGELFDRRLKWADDQATGALCEIVGDSAIPYLIEALSTRFFPPARAGAARTIAKERFLAGVFALRKAALTDSNDDVRGIAGAGLRALNCTPPGTDDMAGYVLSYCPIKTLDAMTAKAKEAGVRALPGLRQTLANGSWMRRRAACKVLASIGGNDAIEELKIALLDVDEDVRLVALESLFTCGWKPKKAREKTLAAIASRRLESLTLVTSDRDLATLNEALNLGGHVFRNEVLDLLERLPEWDVSMAKSGLLAGIRLNWLAMIEGVEGLETTLRLLDLTWQSMPHRVRLARGLQQVEPERLLAAVHNTNCGWRAVEAVCRSLGRRDDDRAAVILEEFLKHRDDDVRRAAFEALAEVGTARAAEAVLEGLPTPFREDRRPAAHALSAIGDNALPVLAGLTKSDWWEYREAAAQAFSYWRGDRTVAVDNLLTLAVDPEPRVSQTAREALVAHGLRPTSQGVLGMLGEAQSLTLEGLEAWLGFSSAGRIENPAVVDFLEKLIRKSKPDELMFRIDLVATLRATPLIGLLEELVKDEDGHLGVSLSASDTLRRVVGEGCPCCTSRGTVDCPGCVGRGEQTCGVCLGESVLLATCPDDECTAGMTMRDIASAACKTCRGTGKISLRCECATGATTCLVCSGGGRIRCPLCDGGGTLVQR
jgi:HEAT repeat protein